jgi:hypothetical protein
MQTAPDLTTETAPELPVVVAAADKSFVDSIMSCKRVDLDKVALCTPLLARDGRFARSELAKMFTSNIESILTILLLFNAQMLPINHVHRIMKEALFEECDLARDSTEFVQTCLSKFVTHITKVRCVYVLPSKPHPTCVPTQNGLHD